jgi:hypothetical protein
MANDISRENTTSLPAILLRGLQNQRADTMASLVFDKIFPRNHRY